MFEPLKFHCIMDRKTSRQTVQTKAGVYLGCAHKLLSRFLVSPVRRVVSSVVYERGISSPMSSEKKCMLVDNRHSDGVIGD